mgnify:FL=1
MNLFAHNGSSENENILLGVIGAILGSIPGLVVWLLLSKLGVIAAISGVVLIAGTLFGYNFFAKKISTFGFVFCTAVVLFMVYFATKLSWCIEIHSECKDILTFKECFSEFSSLLKLTACKGSFIRDLFMGYLITAISAVGAYKKFLK